MKVYVVVYTGGDYIGYFESYVLGVFSKEEDALECKRKGPAKDWWIGNSKIEIEECELV